MRGGGRKPRVEQSRERPIFLRAQSDPLLRTYHDQGWGVPVRDGLRRDVLAGLENTRREDCAAAALMSWSVTVRWS